MTLLTTVSVNVVFLTHSVVTPNFVGAAGNFAISSDTSGVDVAGCIVAAVTSVPLFDATRSVPEVIRPDTPGSLLKLPLFLPPVMTAGSLGLLALPAEVLSVY